MKKLVIHISLLLILLSLQKCSSTTKYTFVRKKISQSLPILTQRSNSDKLKMDLILDSMFIILPNLLDSIYIIQTPVYFNSVVDSQVIYKKTELDYFVYTPSSRNGVYFSKNKHLEYKLLPLDSAKNLKIDKYLFLDTIKTLQKNAIEYYDSSKDLICSYFHNYKTDENYDYDSVKLIYTTNYKIKNKFLSTIYSQRGSRYLYKTIFYFKNSFDKRIGQNIPEREVKIEVSEANNFDKVEVEKILDRYNEIQYKR